MKRRCVRWDFISNQPSAAVLRRNGVRPNAATLCARIAVTEPPKIVEPRQEFRYRCLQTGRTSDILLTSHPSHRSLFTEVTCIKDGFFYWAYPALPGEARA